MEDTLLDLTPELKLEFTSGVSWMENDYGKPRIREQVRETWWYSLGAGKLEQELDFEN
jgi:hypothetical protein